jgi:hypothetical protein
MLKAVVRSARAVGGLSMFCMFSGDNSTEVFHWLSEHNVTIIRHVPLWKDIFALKLKVP